MNREIEFRGEDVVTKEWVYGDLIHELFKIQKDNSTCIRKYTCDGENEYHDVIPETIGQYTGLKDKNGKKIFEGDIVSYILGKPDGDSIEIDKETVTFDYGQLLQLTYADYLEVIGNVYEDNLESEVK